MRKVQTVPQWQSPHLSRFLPVFSFILRLAFECPGDQLPIPFKPAHAASASGTSLICEHHCGRERAPIAGIS